MAEYLPPDMWPPGGQDCNPWDCDVWCIGPEGVSCVNPRSLSFARAPPNMLGRLSTGEIDAAIDIILPRLRKIITLGGKSLKICCKTYLQEI